MRPLLVIPTDRIVEDPADGKMKKVMLHLHEDGHVRWHLVEI